MLQLTDLLIGCLRTVLTPVAKTSDIHRKLAQPAKTIVDRIKDYILTEENLEELVRLTNEELAQTSSEDREGLGILEGQIADVESRLGKLYDALETGKFKSGELAPRTRALTQKEEKLQRAKRLILKKGYATKFWIPSISMWSSTTPVT